MVTTIAGYIRLGLLIILFFVSLRVSSAQIENGGFESGTLTSWTVSGTGVAEVLSGAALDPVSATEGTYFALIGNGPGDIGGDGITDDGSLSSLPFLVPTDGMTLSFDWNFLTAEFTGRDSDPEHLDGFEISLMSEGEPGFLLLEGDVSIDNMFTLITNGDAVTSPGGLVVLEQTGFRSASYVLPAGQFHLVFRVYDDGDGAFDSALAVDNIRISSSAAAPEPSSACFIMFGVFILAACCRTDLTKLWHSNPHYLPTFRIWESGAIAFDIIRVC